MTRRLARWPLLALCAGFTGLVGCSDDAEEAVPPAEPGIEAEAPPFAVTALGFGDLPGWGADDLGDALPAFRLSCAAKAARPDEAAFNRVERLGHPGIASLSGRMADWRDACAAAETASDPRAFFEAMFAPVEVTAPAALFTGYFEPSYPAARAPTEALSAPVLTRPPDLVSVDLGAFKEALRGQDVVGRVEGSRLVPYDDAAEIEADPPEGARTLGYVSPTDLLFLQIQGSGRLSFPDGSVLRAGYAAKNGRPYVAVGRTLVAEGHMPLDAVSMQSIRAWLETAAPEDAARVRHSNPSYVFFRALDLADEALGPLGAQGVQLTPGRSLAVDRRYYGMGTPVWLITEETDENPGLARLMIAQDTGGAIRGPVRGDVFYGAGQNAADLAGTMNAEGRMILLLPRALAARLTAPQA